MHQDEFLYRNHPDDNFAGWLKEVDSEIRNHERERRAKEYAKKPKIKVDQKSERYKELYAKRHCRVSVENQLRKEAGWALENEAKTIVGETSTRTLDSMESSVRMKAFALLRAMGTRLESSRIKLSQYSRSLFPKSLNEWEVNRGYKNSGPSEAQEDACGQIRNRLLREFAKLESLEDRFREAHTRAYVQKSRECWELENQFDRIVSIRLLDTTDLRICGCCKRSFPISKVRMYDRTLSGWRQQFCSAKTTKREREEISRDKIIETQLCSPCRHGIIKILAAQDEYLKNKILLAEIERKINVKIRANNDRRNSFTTFTIVK